MVFWKNIEPVLEVTLCFLNRADVFCGEASSFEMNELLDNGMHCALVKIYALFFHVFTC